MSAKETTDNTVQATTQYWGYRELHNKEIESVGGGYDGDGNTMGDFGGGDYGSTASAEAQAAVDGLYGLTAPQGEMVAGWLGELAKAVSSGVIGNYVYDAIKSGVGGTSTAPAPSPETAPTIQQNSNGTLPSSGSQGAPTFTISSYYGGSGSGVDMMSALAGTGWASGDIDGTDFSGDYGGGNGGGDGDSGYAMDSVAVATTPQSTYGQDSYTDYAGDYGGDYGGDGGW